MPTISEVTLRFSRDLTTLEADCREQQDEIERARQAALSGLPAARPTLLEYERARVEAATIRDNAVAHAAAVFEEAQTQTGNARFAELDTVQRRYVSADRAADDVRVAAQQTEDANYKAKLAEIDGTLPLDRQFMAREAATEEHRKALAVIESSWRDAREANRAKQQDELQAAIDKERLDGEQALDTRNATVTAAQATFQAAVKLALTKVKDALASVPEVRPITAKFDKRQTSAQQDCHLRTESLFAKLHEDLKTATG